MKIHQGNIMLVHRQPGLGVCFKLAGKNFFFNLLLTETPSEDAETYCSVPYVARPSYWQEAHSGETLEKCYFILYVQ